MSKIYVVDSDSTFMPVVDYTGIDWSPPILRTLDENGIPGHGEGRFSDSTGIKFCCLCWLGVAGIQRWYVGDPLCCTLFCLTWGWFGIGSICDFCFCLDGDILQLNREIEWKIEEKVMKHFGELGGERVVSERPQPSTWWWVMISEDGYPSVNKNLGKRSILLHPTENDLYKGDINMDGKPHGNGIVVYDAGEVSGHLYVPERRIYDSNRFLGYDGSAKYSGQWRDGLPEGRGIYTSSSGCVYYGEFVNGEPHGNGTLTDKYGRVIFQGKWIWGLGDYKGPVNAEGLPHGEGGKSLDVKGDRHEGSYEYGKRVGKGKLMPTYSHFFWVGEFVDNKLHGKALNIFGKYEHYKMGKHLYWMYGQ